MLTMRIVFKCVRVQVRTFVVCVQVLTCSRAHACMPQAGFIPLCNMNTCAHYLFRFAQVSFSVTVLLKIKCSGVLLMSGQKYPSRMN